MHGWRLGSGLDSFKERQIAIAFQGLQQGNARRCSFSLQRLQQSFKRAAFGQVEGGAFFIEVSHQDIEVTDWPQRAPQPG